MNRVYEHPNKKLHGTVTVEGPCQSEIKWDNGTVRFCNNENLREVKSNAFDKWKNKRRSAGGKQNGKTKPKPNGGGQSGGHRSA